MLLLTKLFFNQIKKFSVHKINMSCKVAVCQLTASNNKLTNLQVVKKLVNEAVQQNSQVKQIRTQDTIQFLDSFFA